MKHKRILGYSALGLILAALSVAFVKPISYSNILIRARATDVIGGSIVFDKTNATKSGTTNTTAGTTKTGGTVICKTFNNDSTQSSGYVGAVKTGSTIKFFEPDGVTEYTFENLYYVSFSHGGTSFGFNLTGIYDDGSPFEFSYSARTTNPRNINFTNYGKVAHLRVEVTSDIVTLLNSITFTYNCSSKYLSGVEVSTAPTKTSYTAGETFDPTGMVVKAVYSNGSKVVTQAYTYSPTRALLASDTEIVIYYLGFSTSVSITVQEVSGLSGVYSNSSWSIDFDNLTYTYGSEVLHFTYSISGTNITFNYVSGDNTGFGSARLFSGGSSPVTNSTGSITSSTQITVNTYNMFDSATSRKFTKS